MKTRSRDGAVRQHGSPRPLRRSRQLGVGKEIGGCIYIHRAYEHLLPEDLLAPANELIPDDFEYDIIKFCAKSGHISFIECSDFDDAPEPTVGSSWLAKADGTARRRIQPRDPEVYHHKWLLVADDYSGFDVEQSKRRSRAVMELQGIDHRRIGRKSYWEKHVLPKLAKLLRG